MSRSYRSDSLNGIGWIASIVPNDGQLCTLQKCWCKSVRSAVRRPPSIPHRLREKRCTPFDIPFALCYSCCHPLFTGYFRFGVFDGFAFFFRNVNRNEPNPSPTRRRCPVAHRPFGWSHSRRNVVIHKPAPRLAWVFFWQLLVWLLFWKHPLVSTGGGALGCVVGTQEAH